MPLNRRESHFNKSWPMTPSTVRKSSSRASPLNVTCGSSFSGVRRWMFAVQPEPAAEDEQIQFGFEIGIERAEVQIGERELDVGGRRR